MNIAIDVRRIEDFGVGTYIRNLVRTLATSDTVNRYLLLGEPEKVSRVAALPENFRIVEWGQEKRLWKRELRLHQLLQAQGAEVQNMTPEQFSALLKTDYQKWKGIVQASGATIE